MTWARSVSANTPLIWPSFERTNFFTFLFLFISTSLTRPTRVIPHCAKDKSIVWLKISRMRLQHSVVSFVVVSPTLVDFTSFMLLVSIFKR